MTPHRASVFQRELAELQLPQPVKLLGYEWRATSEVIRLRLGDGTSAFMKANRVGSLRPHERERVARRLTEDFVQQQRAHAAMQVGPHGVVRPIACRPERLVMVTEAARGQRLDACLRGAGIGRRAEGVQATFTRVGAWLRAFHGSMPQSGQIALGEVRAYVDARLRRAMEQGGAFGPEERRRVLNRFDALASRVAPRELGAVPIHGDFSLENVLADGERIVALDFDNGAGVAGTRFHDAAYMYICLQRVRPKAFGPPGGIPALQRALLAGFDPALSPANPLFQLMLLQHVSCRLAGGDLCGQGPVRRLLERHSWRHCWRWAGL